MVKQIIDGTYKMYGYRMFDCSIDEFKNYNYECYHGKKQPYPTERFGYIKFDSVDHAIDMINQIFIPAADGGLPRKKWKLIDQHTLALELWFYDYDHQYLYQCAVERAWALGSHLDSRVEQLYYD